MTRVVGAIMTALLLTMICAAAVLVTTRRAPAVECRSDKGDGTGWSWRQVDGKRCWYKGARRTDKSNLRWAAPPKKKEPGQDDRLLYDYWPAMPPDASFSDRFDAIRD